ncbi:hypothetical protein HG536_0D03380 [Torulaspora globosa]|uniref:t-SNARE coiled-coil homology domain-containing protein n=1 Tax=Torulaspora globosa TaxID=48254 RepID=A0A7G3ZH30_9SACH|nr:uncharacterized protein HG536_0D03380 [Torulaspora globosa]QLL32816.1 hypothetical protein HG536_0D03380 [Torulaspora globosa]
MSFFDLEAQRSGSSSSKDANNDTDKALHLILEFTDELKKLDRECSKVGTKRDSLDVRNNIETGLIPHCNAIRDSIEEKLWSSGNEQLRNGSKVHNDFQVLKETLQKQEQRYNDMKMKNVLRKGATKVREEPNSNYVSIEVNEQTPLLLQEEQQPQQNQAQMQDSSLQNEIDFNSIIQRERSQQINRIHSAVQEVNAIFHQLGSLVNEQGEQVDTIDGNIGHFSSNMQKATEQLNRAEEHQRKRNKCGLVTLVVMIVVVLVVILAVLS